MKRLRHSWRKPKMRASDGSAMSCQEPHLYKPGQLCSSPSVYPDLRCYRHTAWLQGTIDQRYVADKAGRTTSWARKQAWRLYTEQQNAALKLPEKRR